MGSRTRLKSFPLQNLYGGVNKKIAPHIIPNNTATVTDNWVLRDKGLTTARGWVKLTDQLLTDGAASPTNETIYKIDEFPMNDGSSILLVFTDKRVYRFDAGVSDLWIPITEGASRVETTTNAVSSANDTTISVVSEVGFAAGELIIVGFDTSDVEYMIVDSTAAGSLTISRPSWAPSGTGLQNGHASGVTVVDVSTAVFAAGASEFSCDITLNNYYFTDGTNPVQVWNGVTDNTSNLGGLEIGDDVEGIGTLTTELKAKQIASFEGFLVLGHLTEEGDTIPQKVRWNKFEDFTSWENNLDGTGQAGFFTFDGPDFIRRFAQLKRELFIYRERSIESMSFIGGTDVFAFRRAETGISLKILRLGRTI